MNELHPIAPYRSTSGRLHVPSRNTARQLGRLRNVITASAYILALAVGLISSHAIAEETTSTTREATWKKFHAYDGTFHIKAPGQPRFLVMPIGEFTHLLYVFRDNNDVWIVSSVDAGEPLPEEIVTNIYRSQMATVVNEVQGKLSFERELKDNGRATLRYGVSGVEQSAMGQVTFIQGRFYHLTRYSPNRPVIEWDEADEFLNSLRLDASRIARNQAARAYFKQHGFGGDSLARVFTLDREGKFGEAADLAGVFLEGAYATFGPDSPDTTTYHSLLGRLLAQDYQFESSLFHLNIALETQLRILPKDDSATILTRGTLATVLRNMSDFTGSRHQLEEILSSERRTKGEQSHEVAETLFGLARTTQTQGRFWEAEPYAEQALALFRNLHGHDRLLVEAQLEHSPEERIAATLDMLGSLATQLRQFPKARVYLNEALESRRKLHGADGLFTGVSEHNLGHLELEEGDAASAVDRFERALAILTSQVDKAGPTHLTTIECRRSLATALVELGKTEEAKEHLIAVVEARRRIFEGPNQMVAAGLSDLACLSLEEGDPAGAIEYLTQAYEIDRQIQVDQHPHPEVVVSNVGSLLLATAQLDLAEKAFEETRRISEAKYGKEHPRVALPLLSLASVAKQRNDFTQAELLLKQAEALLTNKFNADHPQLSELSLHLGKLSETQGKTDQAIDRFQKARQASRRFIASQLSAIPDHEQLRFLATRDRPALEHVLAFGARNGDLKNAAAMSAEWLANGKAVTAEVLADRLTRTRGHDDPAVRGTVAELTIVREQIARTFLNQYASVDREEVDLLNTLTQREAELTKTLSRQPGHQSQGEWVTIDELRKTLPADSVYVDIFRLSVPDAASAETGSPHYIAWIVPPASKRSIRVVDLGPADLIDQMVGQLQREMGEALQEIKEIGEREAALEWRRAAKPLADALFGPLRGELTDAKELIVSPDGALWLVSLDSLPLHDDRYAAEDLRIRYVLSGRDLLRTGAKAKTAGNALVFANPDFDSVDAEASTRIAANRVHAAGANKIPRFSRLAETESEANAIFDNLAIYSKTTPRLVLDREATEESVKAIQSPTALVLCTHGFFLPDQQAPKRDSFENVVLPTDIQSLRDADGNRLENPLLRCGVALAGCNRRDELGPTTDDGLLTGLEVLGLDLTGTQLVVLSACETGVGEPRIGEGVASLRHAFLLAGAECVVSTLWSVENLETARFGKLFFQKLAEGESRSQALHSAKLERIRVHRESHSEAHPFFWASFTLTGVE